MMSKAKDLKQRQTVERKRDQKRKRENEKKIDQLTKNWTFRKEGDLFPKIDFAFNINEDKYQILKGEIFDYDIFGGKVEDKEINKYALFERKGHSFESNLSSSWKADPGLKILTKAGEHWRLWEYSERLPVGAKKTTDKSGGQRGRGRSWWHQRIKIGCEALESFNEVFVIQHESSKGGEAGGRNSQDKEWSNYNIKRVLHLLKE